ncbi:MAG TPA: hypothetical protein VEA40_21730, partial [Ramlibacter sp.]|nr:hypothetical protein [Ramlibacter sp.]
MARPVLARRSRTVALASLTALFLAACGGGGGGSAPPAAEANPPASAGGQQDAGGGAAAPAPGTGSQTPSPPAPPAAVQITSNVVATPNTSYEVVAAGATAVDVSLDMDYFPRNQPNPPATVQVGDTVRVRGVGTAPWRVTTDWVNAATAHSATPPIVISTTSLAGNAAAGVNWTPRLQPMEWHWVASDRLGRVLLAMDNPGQIHVSQDGGQTWEAGNSPVANWVSAAIYHQPSQVDPAGVGPGRVHMLAAAYGGGLFENTGAGWVAVPSGDPAVDFSNREWESVAACDCGVALAAILNAPIYYRAAPGGAWVPTRLQGSNAPLVSGWRGVARAESGVAVAVSQDGDVYVTTNVLTGWVQRNIVIDGAPVNHAWYRTAISRDGNLIAVAGRFTSGLYLSRDQGRTWTRAATPGGDYTAVAVSPDGQTVVATLTNGIAGGTGSVQISRDGGQTFSAAAVPP